ncbi:hypothetical protein [Magnetococcus sp. PR-3]|uniref:hypothetical protein n=1 Tax=Magnetococcus sp. PR-3 TaxID=3120355 RepID=UPI002FCDF85A
MDTRTAKQVLARFELKFPGRPLYRDEDQKQFLIKEWAQGLAHLQPAQVTQGLQALNRGVAHPPAIGAFVALCEGQGRSWEQYRALEQPKAPHKSKQAILPPQGARGSDWLKLSAAHRAQTDAESWRQARCLALVGMSFEQWCAVHCVP